jgi:AraC-like DNA-binding protein
MPYLDKNEEFLCNIASEKSLAPGSTGHEGSVTILGTDGQVEGASLSAWQAQKAKLFMIQNMSSGVLVSAVAQACHLSRSHFSRAFRNSTGSSPRDWIRRAQLTRAANLLVQTDQSISQIALECGFSDQSHFTRVFAKTLGVSPGKWRGLEKLTTRNTSPLPYLVAIWE